MGDFRGLLEDRGADATPRSSEQQRAIERVWRLSMHVTQCLPFSAEAIHEHIDLEASSYLELQPMSKAYMLVCDFIVGNGGARSVRYAPKPSSVDDGDGGVFDLHPPTSRLTTLGIGVFSFTWRRHAWCALHQVVGHPVGTESSVERFTSLVLFAPKSDVGLLAEFCHELVLESERSVEGFVSIFEWEASGEFWMSRAVCPARTLSSVVLEEKVKVRLVEDIQEFLSPDARQWYKDHGIPHKRGYLFHGVPGTGKTSLAQALAGSFQRNLCYVHLSNPRLTDESLRAAVNNAPRKSILILEDVDAAFSKDRGKLIKQSPLTFSGLLNALDGIGKADGQIIVLTTNHRERLNAALIRTGRTDVHVEFTYATDGQVADMFRRFYPASTPNIVRRFTEELRTALAGRLVTCAVLQHFFILHRKSSVERAAGSAQDIVRELELRADENRLRELDGERKQQDAGENIASSRRSRGERLFVSSSPVADG